MRRKRIRYISGNTALRLAIKDERCECGGPPTVSRTTDGKIERLCLDCLWQERFMERLTALKAS